MNSRLWNVLASLAILAATFLPLPAHAQCGKLGIGNAAGSLHQQSWWGPEGFVPGRFLLAHRGDEGDVDPIVGLWRVKFIIPSTPNDIVIDDALAQWHADGTEIMNSNRPPDTSSFCLGVWEKIGHSKYRLNHFAKSWDPLSNTPAGPANIREIVVLGSNGNSFEGAFTIDQYDPAGNSVQHAEGKVTGTRIDINTTTKSLL
jgi:hypothetical protein